jgi:hypothetical protein
VVQRYAGANQDHDSNHGPDYCPRGKGAGLRAWRQQGVGGSSRSSCGFGRGRRVRSRRRCPGRVPGGQHCYNG